VATATGLARSTVMNVLADLKEAEIITATRLGRRNRYAINQDTLLRHPSLAEHKVGDLLRAFFDEAGKN
jgi:DNA-binding transcriptional ArsR family regulator